MLEEMGHEVQFVDYRVGTPLIESNGKAGLYGKLFKVYEALSYDAPLKHIIQFILYKKRFEKKYYSILGLTLEPNYTPELDVLVIGSDEVFNCVQMNPNVGYSLELFGANNRAKRIITYAASFGNTTINKLEKYGKANEIGQLLKHFDAISVRDENSAVMVRHLSGREIKCHLDPVLVYDYIGKCTRIPHIISKEKYLILYSYSGRISGKEADWISQYAKKKKYKIYAIGGVQKCADKFIDCSPFEVLSYFQYAEEVITDTFHGTVFSIITRRQFTTIIRRSVGVSYGNEEKLTDLLNRLDLTTRITYKVDNIPEIQRLKIDYSAVDFTIAEERKRALTYLKYEINL
jgi:hypothetical protein